MNLLLSGSQDSVVLAIQGPLFIRRHLVVLKSSWLCSQLMHLVLVKKFLGRTSKEQCNAAVEVPV